MNDIALWVLGAIATSVIAIVIAVMFEQPIRWWIHQITRNRSARPNPILGKWIATFTIQTGETVQRFTEVIEIRNRFFLVNGFIVPDPKNYQALSKTHQTRPMRLEGELTDNRFFTGKWFHPVELARFHGTFQLILHPRGDTMRGKWLGHSHSTNAIITGDWIWERCAE